MTPRSILTALEANARDAPYRPALLIAQGERWRQLGRADLLAAAEDWARIILAGLPAARPSEQRVAIILLRHGVDCYTAFLGAMRAGLLPCFIPYPTLKQDPALYWQTHQEIFARIDPACVVTYAALVRELQAMVGPDTLVLDAEAPPVPGMSVLPPIEKICDQAAPALLQHSSGTTGLKKGVVLTQGQIAQQVSSYAASLGMGAEDVVASWLPLYHDMGLVTAFMMPVLLGSLIVAIDPFDWLAKPDMLLETIARFRASFCWLPNFAFAHLVNTADDDADYDLSSLRAVIDCSEPCRSETLQAFRNRFERHGLRATALQTCYAMAETVFAVTQSNPEVAPRVLAVDRVPFASRCEIHPVDPANPAAIRFVSCGRPIEGTSIRILPRVPEKVSPFRTIFGGLISEDRVKVGEILIKSTSAFSAYFGNPQATAEAFDDGWYKSGDLGFLWGGELYISGRLKELIIVHGRNFYAHDIESVVSDVPGIKPGRAVAFASYRDRAGSDEAVVLAETLDRMPADRGVLTRAISRAVFSVLGLSLFRVELVPPGMLIKTTSGKLSREENRKRFELGRAA